jgi:hypothetical protein
MQRSYESPEAIEISHADSMILGQKPGCDWDQPTMSFDGNIPTRVDADEESISEQVAQRRF